MRRFARTFFRLLGAAIIFLAVLGAAAVATLAISKLRTWGLIDPSDASSARWIEYYTFRIDLVWYLCYVVYEIVESFRD
jgi:hypothetical protein